MTYRGHIKNGQIMLDEPARLPEGAPVSVEVMTDGHHDRAARIRTPRLADRQQSNDFRKQIVEPAPDAKL